MKKLSFIFMLAIATFTFCQNPETGEKNQAAPQKTSSQNGPEEPGFATSSAFNPTGNTIATRFQPPVGFERVSASPNSFAEYLQQLPLKTEGSPVHLFDGRKKWNQNVHAAVIDMDTGNRDLQQCADAIMRLRAEHLFAKEKYSDIHFNFVSGFRADYSKWREGNRISVNGNKVDWRATSRESTSYDSFRDYLTMVFSYAGTLSLAKEMNSVSVEEMQIGDVFIQGGSPGHAIIVVDMAVNSTTGEKLFLLAQSYMPAQEIHVLKNPNDSELSPWYPLNFGEYLNTPEWGFSKNDLKRF